MFFVCFFSPVFGNKTWVWRLTCSSWTSRSTIWSWMWGRSPRSSWRATAGPVQVRKGAELTMLSPAQITQPFLSLQVSTSSAMAGPAPGPTPAPLSTASVCHPLRPASSPWVPPAVMSAPRRRSMRAAAAPQTRASRPSRGPPAFTWAAAGFERRLLGSNKHDPDPYRQVAKTHSAGNWI